MSDFPATCFVVNDAEPDKMLTCDLAFREFPGLLKGVYEYEKKLQVEGIGVKYRLGDFYINFMTLSLGQSPTIKGLLLEVSSYLCMITCYELRFFSCLFPPYTSIRSPSSLPVPLH